VSICHKIRPYSSTQVKLAYSKKAMLIWAISANKGHNSKVLYGIWLVIKLGRDILPSNIFTKFNDYTMKTIKVINALDAAGGTCSHNTSHFFKQAYKKPKSEIHLTNLVT